MIFGYIDYVITGDSFTKFYRRIMSDKLPVSKMCEKNGRLTLRMPAEHCKALERPVSYTHLTLPTIRLV